MENTQSSRVLKDAIIDVPGIQVGHSQDLKAGTGCTVIICDNGAVTGVDVRGGAPGTRGYAGDGPFKSGKSGR